MESLEGIFTSCRNNGMASVTCQERASTLARSSWRLTFSRDSPNNSLSPKAPLRNYDPLRPFQIASRETKVRCEDRGGTAYGGRIDFWLRVPPCQCLPMAATYAGLTFLDVSRSIEQQTELCERNDCLRDLVFAPRHVQACHVRAHPSSSTCHPRVAPR